MIKNKKFGTYIRELRIDNKIGQRELAQKIGVAASYLNDIEKNKRSAPKFKKISFIKIKQLYKISPLGTFSMLCTGLIHSAIFGYGAVYATTLNFTIFEISLFLFLITIAGAIFQFPIGYFSDMKDRRIIIIGCTFLSSIFFRI